MYTGELRSALATDSYTTAGGDDDEIFEAAFTFHGFRFCEVSGLYMTPTEDMFTHVSMRSAVPTVGSIAFPAASARVLNQLQHAAQWSLSGNLFSLQSDCNNRDERKGWLGDSALSLYAAPLNFELGAFYSFWALSMRDSQETPLDEHPVGALPDTVPHTFAEYPADPAWGSAFPGVIYTLWRHYGDTRAAASFYDSLAAYISFLQLQIEDEGSSGIANLFGHYGDWVPPPNAPGGSGGADMHLTSGIAFLTDLQRMIELATALGKEDDVANYTSYRAKMVAQFNAAWLNAETGGYGATQSQLQSSTGPALMVGAAAAAGPAVVASAGAALVADLAARQGHFACGILGMRHLHVALTAAGAGEAALDSLLGSDYPSYGYMFNNELEPATTLWELMDGPAEGPSMNSRAHHMWSPPAGWLFEDVAGLSQRRQFTAAYDPTDVFSSGWRHPVFFPRVTSHPNVSWASGSMQSPSGLFTFSWAANASAGPGSTCVAGVNEGGTAEFACAGGYSFVAVDFASFGTPTGTCEAGFKKGSCDSPNSTSVTAAACVGRMSCSVPVSSASFGGDPCLGTSKQYSAQLTCGPPAPGSVPGIAMQIGVPGNARATVRVPFAANASSTAAVFEGGAPVFAKGAFVPGVAGVTGASLNARDDLPLGLVTVDVEVLSGEFSFTSFH
jgi:hypothetical protein